MGGWVDGLFKNDNKTLSQQSWSWGLAITGISYKTNWAKLYLAYLLSLVMPVIPGTSQADQTNFMKIGQVSL